MGLQQLSWRDTGFGFQLRTQHPLLGPRRTCLVKYCSDAGLLPYVDGLDAMRWIKVSPF